MYFQLLLHSSNEVMCSTVCCFLLSNPMSVLKWGMGGSRKALCIAVSFGLQRTLMQIHEYYQEPKLIIIKDLSSFLESTLVNGVIKEPHLEMMKCCHRTKDWRPKTKNSKTILIHATCSAIPQNNKIYNLL